MTAARADRPSLADSRAVALVLIAALGAVYALIAWYAFDRFPYSGDEYSLALQGELFARGVLNAPAPPHASWLQVDHVVIDALVRSKYPPGASALLGLGERWGAAWLVTPLEAVAGLLVVWATVRRALGARAGLIALVALGLAPLYAIEAASFYAHTAALMLLAVSFAAVAAWTRQPRDHWLVVAGAALGCAFLVRPIDGVLFGVAMLALRSWRAVIVTALAALPLVAVNFWYQAQQFGSPFTDGYHAYEPALIALYGPSLAPHPFSLVNIWDPVQLWNHFDISRAFAIGWTVPGAIIVALFGAQAIGTGHPARRLRTFAIALVVVFLAALLLTTADVDDGPRPRYLTPLLLPLAVLTAAGFGPAVEALAARFGRRVRSVVVALAVLFAMLQIGSAFYDRAPQIWAREGLYTAVSAAQISDAIVIVRARYPSRFARNGPWFDRRVLYLAPPAGVPADAVQAAYPGRAIWEAREGAPWTLRRVQ